MTQQGLTSSPFRSWNGVAPHEFVDGVTLHAIGGEQVLLVRVVYEPGMRVPPHKHEEVEQIMAILEGEGTLTVEGEERTLKPGDLAVINRQLEHSFSTDTGVTFFEALAPVPLDHVPNPERDLVLGPFQGQLHVER